MQNPFKLVGNKQRVMDQILPHVLPLAGGRRAAIVGFAGTGAAAIALHEAGVPIAHLSDGNPHLVAVLQNLRAAPAWFTDRIDLIAREVEQLPSGNAQRDWYYRAREDLQADFDVELFVILWRMAFNGLVRYTRGGKFSAVGIQKDGAPRRKVIDRTALEAWGHVLGRLPRAEVRPWQALPKPDAHTWAYHDPPYEGTHDTFTPGGHPFPHADWEAYLGTCQGPWAASNSRILPADHPACTGVPIMRPSNVSSDGAGRAEVQEWLTIRRA